MSQLRQLQLLRSTASGTLQLHPGFQQQLLAAVGGGCYTAPFTAWPPPCPCCICMAASGRAVATDMIVGALHCRKDGLAIFEEHGVKA